MTDPLIIDAYEGDSERHKLDLYTLAKAGAPWHGVYLKSSEGTYYNGGAWFVNQWRLAYLSGQAANRGQDWLRGAYHYYSARLDPVAQADYFIANLRRAGGILDRDVLMVDVESGGQKGPITGSQVVDGVSKFVERVRGVTGHWVMLYGGSWLYELGITSRMGCRYLAIARYTPDLPAQVYQRIGWGRDSLAMWQYCGVDGSGVAVGSLRAPANQATGAAGELYPLAAPGCGAVDISALVLPGGVPALFGPVS